MKASPVGHISVTVKYILCGASKLFQSLSSLEDRHSCLVLESVYALIRDSGNSHLRVKLFPKDCFQCCVSSALSSPHCICSTENLFHLITGFTSYLHGHCSFHFIAKITMSNRKPSLQHRDKLKQTPICVRSLVPSGLGGHFPTAGCWIRLSLVIWSRKHHSEIILPLQFVLGRLLVFAVDSKPCADQ